MLAAAVSYQRIFRGMRSRSQWQDWMRRRAQASKFITARMYAQLMRKRAQRLLEQKRIEFARKVASSRLIQRIWRGYRARVYVIWWRALLTRSVVRVQRNFRSFRLWRIYRRWAQLRRERMELELCASIHIQRHWRAYAAWKFVQHRRFTWNAAAGHIQRVFRGWCARIRVAALRLRLNHSARMIQRAWAMVHPYRQALMRRDWAARVVQRGFRFFRYGLAMLHETAMFTLVTFQKSDDRPCTPVLTTAPIGCNSYSTGVSWSFSPTQSNITAKAELC